MRKLIEFEQENLIECDTCDFVIPNEDPKNPGDGIEYLNVPCPKCGENLLTEKDYLLERKFDARVNWINKWFSWLTFFYPKSNKSKSVTSVKIHNGIKIESDI